jgi:hypothetical protein
MAGPKFFLEREKQDEKILSGMTAFFNALQLSHVGSGKNSGASVFISNRQI